MSNSLAGAAKETNTLDKGVVEFTIFQEDEHYVGVCLTFDIVVEGGDYDEVRKDVIEAAKLHLETVQKENLPESLLNRPAPKEYWDKRGGVHQVDDHVRKEAGIERRLYSADRPLARV